MTRCDFVMQQKSCLFGLLVSAMIFSIACSNNHNRQGRDSFGNAAVIPQDEKLGVETDTKVRNSTGAHDTPSLLDTIRLDEKHFSFSTTVKFGTYSTTLISYCYDDTLEADWVMYGENGWPIVQKQVLVFKQEDNEIRRHLLPLRIKVCKTRCGESVRCLVADVDQLCGHNVGEGLVEVQGSEPGTGMDIPLFIGIYGFDGSTGFEGYLGGERINEKGKIDRISRLESELPDTCKRMVCIHCRRVEVSRM